MVSAPYLWSAVKTNLGTKAALAVLPEIGFATQRPFSGFKGYGVSKYSLNPTIAHLFARYLTSEENQYYRYVQKGFLPTFEGSMRIDEAIAESEEASVFHQSLENSIPMPNILKMADFWAPMQDAWTSLWGLSAPITQEQVEAILITATENILG